MGFWRRLSAREKSRFIFYLFILSILFGTALFVVLVKMRGPKPRSKVGEREVIEERASERLRLGQKSYHIRGCVKCHGRLGAGDGYKGLRLSLERRPRDLRDLGGYKQGISRGEIIETIKNGVRVRGSAMPKYPFFVEEEYRHLADYIIYLQTNEGK